jgi:hypothetical protein
MKKIMMAVALASFGFVGCADICAKAQECAKKSGDSSYSQTECQNDAKIQQEKATNAGCGAEYNAYVACVAALDCTTLANGGASSECGDKAKAYSKCIE